jgi:hypothetical protein
MPSRGLSSASDSLKIHLAVFSEVHPQSNSLQAFAEFIFIII